MAKRKHPKRPTATSDKGEQREQRAITPQERAFVDTLIDEALKQWEREQRKD